MHSQTNVLNGNGKLIGTHLVKFEYNHAVTHFGDKRVIVVAQHESEGSRVRLLDLDLVTTDLVESDPQIVLLNTLDFGEGTAGFTISCHGQKTCLVAGSSAGAPAWFVFHKPESGDLESCGP
jgi:hypothetical protein